MNIKILIIMVFRKNQKINVKKKNVERDLGKNKLDKDESLNNSDILKDHLIKKPKIIKFASTANLDEEKNRNLIQIDNIQGLVHH